MKKTYVMIVVAILSIATFSSCNKNKKDIKKLDQEVADLQNQNSTLQNQLNTTNGALGSIANALGTNEPLIVNFSTMDTTASVVQHDTLLFASRTSMNEYMKDNGDGTYNVRITRYKSIIGQSEMVITFTYNPSTKIVTAAHCLDICYINSAQLFFSFNSTTTGTTLNINVTDFDYNTGKIALTIAGSTTTTSGDNYYMNGAMNIAVSFAGVITPTK